MSAEESPESEREETEAERDDRLWDDMLQELRVVQTGAQLMAGFLLTLPFQQGFHDLSGVERSIYLILVVLAATVIALVLTPVAIHRRLAGRHVKGRLVKAAARIIKLVLGAIAVLIIGITAFVFDVVVGGVAAVAVGAGLGLALAVLLVGVPRMLVPEDQS